MAAALSPRGRDPVRSPALLAASAFTAGDLLGLRVGASPWIAAAAACLALVPLARRRSRRGSVRRSRDGWATVATVCGLAAAAGWAAGAQTGRVARASCEAGIRDGDAVGAVGVLAETAGRGWDGRAAGRARVRLRPVELTVGNGRCSLPGLVAYVQARGEPPRAGARIRVAGRWVGFGRASVWPAAPGRRGIVVGELVGVEPAAPADVRIRLRESVSRRLRRRLPADVEPLARALFLAERDGIEPALRRRFADAGMAHLLAISGLHVGILAGLLHALLRLWLPPARTLAAVVTLTGAYVALIGAPEAALRAWVLLAGWAAARAGGRPARTADLLGGAAALTLALRPAAVLEPGFQLSFAGFTGLVCGNAAAARLASNRGEPRPGRPPRALAVGLAGAGAWAATAPVAAAHFQRVAPVSVLSHLPAAPLTGLSLAGLLGATILPGAAGELFAAGATGTLRLLVRLAEHAATLPLGHGDVAPPSPRHWLLVVATAAGLRRWLLGGRPLRATLPLAAAAAVCLTWPGLTALRAGGRTLICSLDVGQGDGAVLRTARGHWVVFDAGPRVGSRDAGRDVLVPRLARWGASGIDLFVLSHPDLDHIGGAGALFERYRVRRVLDTGDPVAKPAYASFLARVEESGARWLPARTGDRLRLDEITVTVLGPVAASDGRPAAVNATSLSVRVTARGFVYLNTGDADAEAEAALRRRWPVDSLRAHLLKVGHHGSRSSSSLGWLEAVSPAIAFISSGAANRYGHPHPEVLTRLRAAGVPRVWRADRQGSLCVEVDAAGRWRVRGELRWHAS